MEMAKPVIWVRSSSIDQDHLLGLFPLKDQYRIIGIFWSIFHVARPDCSTRVSTRSLTSKSSLAAKI